MNFKWREASRIVFVLYSLFLLSCSNDSEVEKEGDCRLVSFVRRNTPDIKNSTRIEKTEAKYSSDGKLLEYVASVIDNDNAGNLSNKTESKASYTYNEEGLLIELTDTYDQVFPLTENLTSSVIQYRYENGMLVERKTHSISNLPGLQSETTAFDTWVYDANGNPIQNTFSYIEQGLTKTRKTFYVWKHDKIEEITHIDFDGNESKPEIKTNDSGLIIQYKSSSDSESRYEYDHEGNVTRSENWLKGKLANYETFVYDSKSVPTKSLDRVKEESFTYLFKMYGNGIPTRNILKHERFNFDLTGNQRDVETTIWTHKYNAAGFPVESIRASSFQGVTYTSYQEYIYEGCK